MHTPHLYLGAMVAVTSLLVGYTAYLVHDLVVSYATYPEEIHFNGTYWEKLQYTLEERIHLPKTLVLFAGLLLGGNLCAVLLLAGLVHLLP